jgi:hypothetical protein
MISLLEVIFGIGVFSGGVGTGIGILTIKRRREPISYLCQCSHTSAFHTRKTKRDGDNVEVVFGNCNAAAARSFGDHKCGCQGYIGDVPPATPAMITYDPPS